jgi:hypothetical protein
MPLIERMRDQEVTRFEAESVAEQAWLEEVQTGYEGLLIKDAQSWFTGYNSNLEGHEYGKTRYTVYPLGGVEYGKRLAEIAQSDYKGIDFS